MEYGAPMQYRIPLEGGDVLVLTLEIEMSEEREYDAATVGQTLLGMLGLGRPTTGKAPAKEKTLPPEVVAARKANDENPDTWLRRTSEASYGQRFPRRLRAEGDIDD